MCFIAALAFITGAASALLAFSICFDIAMLILGVLYRNQHLIDATAASIENVFWPCVILGFISLILLGISTAFDND